MYINAKSCEICNRPSATKPLFWNNFFGCHLELDRFILVNEKVHSVCHTTRKTKHIHTQKVDIAKLVNPLGNLEDKFLFFKKCAFFYDLKLFASLIIG